MLGLGFQRDSEDLGDFLEVWGKSVHRIRREGLGRSLYNPNSVKRSSNQVTSRNVSLEDQGGQG